MKYFNAFGYRTIGSTTLAGTKSATMPDSPVYELPEECDLVRKHPPESDQEAYERNERIGLAAWAEVERLRRIVSRPLGEPVPVEAITPSADPHVRMMRGLVRCAELKEQEEGGTLWDDECRDALAAARRLNWGSNAIGKMARVEPPPHEPTLADVNRVAAILIDAWAKAEPTHGVTLHPASYAATFVDMARAVLFAANAGRVR